MSILNRLLGTTYLRAPEGGQGGGGDGGNNGGGNNGGQNNGGGDNGADGMPAGLDAKFWDPATKSVRTPELIKSYGEIQSLVTRRATEYSTDDFNRLVDVKVGTMTKEIQANALKELRGQVPEKPENYQTVFSKEQLEALPEHLREVQLDNDPLVAWWRGEAHRLGLGQEGFIKGIHSYMGIFAEQQKTHMTSEMSRLGENGKARVEAVTGFLDANLPKEQAAAIRRSMASADVVAALESLIKKGSSQSVTGGVNGGVTGIVGVAMSTEKELRAAQQDPRYWDPLKRDLAFVKQIEDGWRRLGGTAR